MSRDCPTCRTTPTLVAVPKPYPFARCEVFARACAGCGHPFTFDGVTWPWAAAEAGVAVLAPAGA
jgi:hypothetical protein